MIEASAKILFFGCWNQPGHFLVKPGGHWVRDHESPFAYPARFDIWLDSGYAPRRARPQTRAARRFGDYGLCWIMQGDTADERRTLHYDSDECEQGHFLRHEVLDHTLLQWWDRAQGDTRGACNSTIIVHGKNTSEEMLAALREHFPHVVANLTKAGIELREVTP